MEIIKKLSEVMGDVGAVRKGERNQAQGFNFRGIDSVVNAVSPALRKHGVIVVPRLLRQSYETVTVGRNATQMGHARVEVEYTFWADDGSYVSCSVAAESMDSGDKATAKAMSVAFRTALLQTLCVPTDEVDPDHDVFERTTPAKPAAKPQIPSQFPEEPKTIEKKSVVESPHKTTRPVVRMEKQPTGKDAHPSNQATGALVKALENSAKNHGDPVEVVSDILGRTLTTLAGISTDDAQKAINNLADRNKA